jgi:hypothetical protein
LPGHLYDYSDGLLGGFRAENQDMHVGGIRDQLFSGRADERVVAYFLAMRRLAVKMQRLTSHFINIAAFIAVHRRIRFAFVR